MGLRQMQTDSSTWTVPSWSCASHWFLIGGLGPTESCPSCFNLPNRHHHLSEPPGGFRSVLFMGTSSFFDCPSSIFPPAGFSTLIVLRETTLLSFNFMGLNVKELPTKGLGVGDRQNQWKIQPQNFCENSWKETLFPQEFREVIQA